MKKCNLCQKKTKPQVLFEKEDQQILKCRHCGLVYSSFSSSKDEIKKMYQEDYFLNKGKNQIRKPGYANYQLDEKCHRQYFAKKIKKIKKLRSQGKFLDIGCALGYFLVEAKKEGFEPLGVDLSAYSVSFAQKHFGLEVIEDFFENTNFDEASFDVVVMIQTLEHVPDINQFLSKVNRILKPGGIFLLTTPNQQSFWAKILGKHWFHYKPKEHCYYFSAQTIRKFLEKAGLEIISLGSDDLMPLRLGRIIERLAYFYRLPRFKSLEKLVLKLGISEVKILLWLNDLEVIARKR